MDGQVKVIFKDNTIVCPHSSLCVANLQSEFMFNRQVTTLSKSAIYEAGILSHSQLFTGSDFSNTDIE